MARFMLFIHPGISAEEYAAGPQLEDVEAMMRYNAELSKAGALLAGDGLQPEVTRVGRGGVVDGPFSEAKELVGGYWIIQAKDRAEAVEWASRCPLGDERLHRGPPDRRGRRPVRGAAGGRDLGRAWAGADRRVVTTSATIEAVWRIESGRLIAGLARMLRDVSLAEDLAQDAFVAALEKWPESGVPDNPGAWLMAVAKHRAIDLMRRSRRRDAKHAEIGLLMAVSAVDEVGDDDLLSLIFTACHPHLSIDARVALTLRMLGGLSTPEIARAFLVSEATVAQRIVRAKKALAGVPFAIPGGDELAERTAGVLEVVYLIFNEGYSATAGDDWVRPALCEDALRLARVLSVLMPRSGEVWGLLALLEIQASRMRARVARDGTPILLADQDRSRWDPLLIQRGLHALRRAEGLGLGVYGLQAAIAACHARAAVAADTDWVKIAALYETLARVAPSPVVELNRAVAIGMAFGPEAALRHVDALVSEPSLSSYHLLPSVRGDLLAKVGRAAEARAEFERAASLTSNTAERDLLLARAASL